MRTSRVMALMIAICFTFVGASLLWGGEKEFKCGSHGNLKVHWDNSGKFQKFTLNGATVPPDRTYNAANGDLTSAGLELRDGQMMLKVREMKDGTWLKAGDGSCYYYYSGGTLVRKCVP